MDLLWHKFALLVVVGCALGDPRSRPIPIASLEGYIKQMDASDGWKAEFASLGEPQTQLKTWNYALRPENIAKTRYPPPEDNLLTYDETRVNLLRVPGDPTSDFINANWIDGYEERRQYIATQCPMESTASDFYRMVWQYNIHQVIMLASPHDIEKGKCFKYFPDASIQHGGIEVTLQRKTEFPDIVVRIYTLKRGSQMRVFVHHHFVSWPDLGVPQDPKQLLRLIRTYRSSDTYTKAWPVVVHCSAGVGRTGTFLLTDAMYEMAENEDHVDFLSHLSTIRNQRISVVEKPEQYALAHRVVAEACKEDLFVRGKAQAPYSPQALGLKANAGNKDGARNPVNTGKTTNIVVVNPDLGDQEIVIRLTSTDATCQR